LRAPGLWHSGSMLYRHGSFAAVMVVAALLVSACTAGSPSTSSPTSPAQPMPQDTPRAGDQKASVSYGGHDRSYLVHAPSTYDGTSLLPLVVAMHYFPGDGAGVAKTTGLNAKADKENFLVVYPDGYANGFNALVCCGSEDDVGFIKLIVKHMVDRWKADPKRVYATGISNGADMSFRLAVELPEVFAAIAPVSGGYGGAKTADPAYIPKLPVSVITFLGGLDMYRTPMEEGLKLWQERLSCKASSPQALPNKGINLTVARCADGSEVAAYRLPTMGHNWPGPQQGHLADSEAGLNATDLLWDFFKTKSR